MTKPNKEPVRCLTREQMQTEAMIIESLLSGIMAMQSGTYREEAVTLIEMAHDRARKLCDALDSIHEKTEAAA